MYAIYHITESVKIMENTLTLKVSRESYHIELKLIVLLIALEGYLRLKCRS